MSRCGIFCGVLQRPSVNLLPLISDKGKGGRVAQRWEVLSSCEGSSVTEVSRATLLV